jgi:cell wall-associated NlpC family hydrolase
MTHERVRRAGFRQIAWTAVIGTALCVTIARPAFADPVPPAVPDVGSRPAVGGSFQLPGTSQPGGLPVSTLPAATTPGPLGQQIITDTAAVETVGQQLLKLDADLDEARRNVASAREAWDKATRELSDLRDRAGREAGEAYKAATALGPLDKFASDLHQLSVLAPGLGQQPGGQATARDVERADQLERAAFAAHQSASSRVEALSRQRDTSKAEYDKRNAALTDLRTRNSTAYQQELAAIDAQRASIGATMKIGEAAKGTQAAPEAMKALQAAISKLGAPYVWGDEGPNTFDCSGLVLWSYQQVGYTGMPRVANDQYAHTSGMPVKVEELLPGDLLFFATDKADPRSIHHVAMYYGNGYMLHAPTTGDVVKVSPVWWAEYYGATRVYRAAPAPSPAPPSSTPSKTTAPPTGPGSSSSTPPSTPPSSSTSAPPSSTPPSSAPPSTSTSTPAGTPAGSGTPSAGTGTPSAGTGTPSAGSTASASSATSASSTASSAAPAGSSPSTR